MSRYHRRPLKVYVPAKTYGNLYYLRLKTKLGIFYKLGFTSLSSAEERIAFNGNGDELSIDKVLFFHYFENAFEVEQQLLNHFPSAFGKFSSREYMPFAKNGQSELYVRDILGLDSMFTEEQAAETLKAISKAYSKRKGTEFQDEIFDGVGNVLGKLLLPVLHAVFWVAGRTFKLMIKPNQAEKHAWDKRAHETRARDEKINVLVESLKEIAKSKAEAELGSIRLKRAEKLNQLNREAGLNIVAT